MKAFSARRASIEPSNAELAFVLFQRVIAAYCLLFGILYWIRLIGYHPGSLWRFDLMPVQWQVASVCLAVFFPFAAIGLWMTASWGAVVWIVCAVAETVMYLVYPHIYGLRLPIILAHGAALLIYLTLWFFVYRERKALEEESSLYE